MTVGRNAVTPYRGSRAASSPMRAGADVTSIPCAPLICRSMKPGTIHPPAASMSSDAGLRADGGDALALEHELTASDDAVRGVERCRAR